MQENIIAADAVEKVTGYQWGAHMRYLGPYTFDVVIAHGVHLPPNTTLKEPPDAGPGQFAEWQPEGDCWVLRVVPAAVPPAPIMPPEQLMDPEEFAQREATARAEQIARAEAANGN